MLKCMFTLDYDYVYRLCVQVRVIFSSFSSLKGMYRPPMNCLHAGGTRGAGE